jgi:hypothetical protein
MADPISLLAVAGLVYAGRTLSKTEKYKPENKPIVTNNDGMDAVSPSSKGVDDGSRFARPSKVENENFADITRQQRSSGQEVLNMRNRMFDHGRMNNLSPSRETTCWSRFGCEL